MNRTSSARSSPFITLNYPSNLYRLQITNRIFYYSTRFVEQSTYWITSVSAYSFFIAFCYLPFSLSQKFQNSSLLLFFFSVFSTWPRLHLDSSLRYTNVEVSRDLDLCNWQLIKSGCGLSDDPKISPSTWPLPHVRPCPFQVPNTNHCSLQVN